MPEPPRDRLSPVGLTVLAVLALAGCATAGPPIANDAGGVATGVADGADAGPPEIRVVYPPSGATLSASDSTFIFGSVSPADARVTVNGIPAHHAPGGGWLAWVPIAPGDFVFHVEASRGARVDWLVRVSGEFTGSWNGMVDRSSVTPHDTLELEPGDPVEVRFKGVAGLDGRVVVGEGLGSAPLIAEATHVANAGRQIFGEVDTAPVEPGASRPGSPAAAGGDWSWYAAEVIVPPPLQVALERGAAGTGAAGSPVGRRRTSDRPTAASSAWAYGSSAPLTLEVETSDSVLRLELPSRIVLRDPRTRAVALLDDDPSRTGRTDGTVVGRTAPDGVFLLFLPDGAHAATGRRIGGFVELRLARDLSVWAAADEVHSLPVGTPTPASRVPVVRTRRLGRWTRITIPLAEALPVQVRQQSDPVRYEVTIFGARAAIEFMRTDFGDPLVRELRWNQPASDRFVLHVELNQRQAWGYRYGYAGSDFYLDVRHGPELRSGLFRSILKGLRIVVDPGHSPDAGATGPTGFQEKDANLAVALELTRELRAKGAEVIMTRTSDAPEGFGLNDRTNLAAREEADLLISVHHNALPDGVNPFQNNGTSTYYYHPQSLPLTRAIQAELLKELGLPDFGVAFGNLALLRPTQMPAVLTEAAFMMIPEQEELVRTEAFRKREATAIRKGIERFLEEAKRRESEEEEKRK